MNRAATVRERFSAVKQDRFLTGAARTKLFMHSLTVSVPAKRLPDGFLAICVYLDYYLSRRASRISKNFPVAVQSSATLAPTKNSRREISCC